MCMHVHVFVYVYVLHVNISVCMCVNAYIYAPITEGNSLQEVNFWKVLKILNEWQAKLSNKEKKIVKSQQKIFSNKSKRSEFYSN